MICENEFMAEEVFEKCNDRKWNWESIDRRLRLYTHSVYTLFMKNVYNIPYGGPRDGNRFLKVNF